MSTVQPTIASQQSVASVRPVADDLLARVESAFQQPFAVLDPSSGKLENLTPDWPRIDLFRWLPLCEHLAKTGRPEILEDHAPLALVVVPLRGHEFEPSRVAIGLLLTVENPSRESIESAAVVYGLDADELVEWAARRRTWPSYAALPLLEALVEADAATASRASDRSELNSVSNQLLATFEELNLLHQLTERLTLDESESDLVDQSVRHLAAVIPSDCIVANLSGGATSYASSIDREPPIGADQFGEFFDRLGPEAARRTLVLNATHTSSPIWSYPEIRQVVSAPVISNDQTIGWIAAINYRPTYGIDEGGFGAVEASLLTSVATLIGVHAGNHELFTQRNELFHGAVQALSAAIDAKDPYTKGHSDRVARIAVRLAEELNCSEEECEIIYLGGILHDVGKIGTDEQILRKPGQLTEAEYEHIKAHPKLGEQILRGIPQLAEILPIVLHHHEQWDGLGYPTGLANNECPKLARITAVADSIDAMRSDRPYREGMPGEEVDRILRKGTGTQWDPAVIKAYFTARDDIDEILQQNR